MKQLLTIFQIFSALLFCGFAVPCNAEIVFSNNGTTNTGWRLILRGL
jgi:hypothetical protein